MTGKEEKKEDSQNPEFSLTSTSSAFTERSHDIFKSLQGLEEQHKEHEKSRVDTESSSNRTRNSFMKNDPTEEDTEVLLKSNFKKPSSLPSRISSIHESGMRSHDHTDDGSVSRSGKNSYKRSYDDMQNKGNYHGCNQSQDRRYPGSFPRRGGRFNRNKTPDHKINPQKWTKYSLEDVTEDDLSESANTWAAFSFLDDLKKQRELREGNKEEIIPADVEGGACSKGQITFTRPNKKSQDKNNMVGNKEKSLDAKISSQFSDSLIKDGEMVESEESVHETVSDKSETTFKVCKVNKNKRNIRRRGHGSDDD